MLPSHFSFADQIHLPVKIQKKYADTLSSLDKGNFEKFQEKVSALRNAMFRAGLFSINSFVDEVNEKIKSIDDKRIRLKYLRTALQISPLNVKYWLYVALSDLFNMKVFLFAEEVADLYRASAYNPVAMLKSVFVIYGFIVLTLQFFTLFFTLAILFKYIPTISGDLIRYEMFKKMKPVLEPLLLILFFSSMLFFRAPFTIFFIWLTLLSVYMVNRELVTTVVLAGAVISMISLGGTVDSYSKLAIFPSQKNLLHLAYGIVDGVKGLEVNMDDKSPLELAGKARYEFVTGNYGNAIKRFKKLEEGYGKDFSFFVAASYYYSGKSIEAEQKLDKLGREGADDPAIMFSLYQVLMSNYKFDAASKIRSQWFKKIENKRPFNIETSSISSDILVPPTISVRFLLETLEPDRGGTGKKMPFHNLWMNPLIDPRIFFLAAIGVIFLLRAITLNRYLTVSCRVCGDRQMVKTKLKKESLCQICKSKSLLVKASSDKSEKVLSVRFHKVKVRMKSFLVPGFGFISIDAVTSFILINLYISLTLAGFVMLKMAFPSDYSPLYALISKLGQIILTVLLVGGYCFILMVNEITLRSIYKKYKIKGA